ncbi:hypothetical protein [Pseudovibrio sp. Ad26]|uniref:hypothetical protein n=1 Tax=Pseudovibrio sp. Ad26 TaxID=989410 RepID=UPI0007AE56D9|nr:hypothetical protein [Pseudovibrio sp. Ad26]KZL05984.1 hypothetical protein PsAD26_04130 [Pseudovibrio sp. Ad26]
MSELDDLRAELTEEVDDVMGEPVLLAFLDGEQRSDATRENTAVNAVLRCGAGHAFNLAKGSKKERTSLSAEPSFLELSRSDYDGPMPKTGDKVQALTRAGLPWFEVLDVSDRGASRIILELGEA